MCLFPFEQFIEQQMVQLQNSILECLHYHTFSDMLSNMIFETHHVQILLCFGLGAIAWFTTQLIFPTFRLSSLVFSTTLWMWLGLPNLSIVCIPWCVCTHPIGPIGVHLLCCTHGNRHMGTHDAIHDTFASIVGNVNFHVRWKRLHVFPSTMFNSSCQWVKIVLTKDDIHTLIDVFIANPMWADWHPKSCATQEFLASNVAQAKEKNYCDWHPIDQFLPLGIEVFRCLHK
jgi:hypothetical protein